MNLMLLAFLAIVLLCALLGYHRGLLKSALSAIGIVGAILLANLLNPYVRTFICEHTGIREEVRQRIELGLNADQLDVQGSVYGKEGYLENTDLPEIVKNYIRSSDSIRKGQETLSEYVHAIHTRPGSGYRHHQGKREHHHHRAETAAGRTLPRLSQGYRIGGRLRGNRGRRVLLHRPETEYRSL